MPYVNLTRPRRRAKERKDGRQASEEMQEATKAHESEALTLRAAPLARAALLIEAPDEILDALLLLLDTCDVCAWRCVSRAWRA